MHSGGAAKPDKKIARNNPSHASIKHDTESPRGS